MSSKATKTKNGRWRCKAYYTDEKGKYTSKSFTEDTKRKAEAAAAAFLVDLKHDAKPENKTLGELADAFIENRSNLISPSTLRGYKSIRKNAFKSITDCRIGLLTKEVYQKAINDYAEGHSYKTVFSAHVFFNKVLKENNIFIGENVNLPPRVKNEIKIPTIEEVQKFMQDIADTRLYLYCLFAVCLGLRKSEAIALQWKDIDFEQKTVSVTKAKVRDEFGNYVEKQTKTNDGMRTLHLPQVVIEALGSKGNPNDLIIVDSPKALESLYNRAKVTYDFPYNYHALRHFYASVMLLNGIPNRYAKERMGHSSEDMLVKVYQHTMKSQQDSYDTVLDDFFESKLAVENAETESNKMTGNIIFKNDSHRDFFLRMMEKCHKDDNYHRAFFYLVGVTSETRDHVEQLFSFSADSITPDGLHTPWQTSGTLKICRLAFNLWCGYANGDASDYTPYELFDCGYAPYMLEAVKLMYANNF